MYLHSPVLEYSEITPEMASLRVDQCKQQNDLCHSKTTNNGKNVSPANNDSRLVYSHGNICVHFMTRSFLERVCQDDIQMQMKYHRAQKKVSFPRNEQFSPIKNGPGSLKDCPKTARNDLLNYHTQLAKSAGAILINDSYAVSNGNGGHQDGVYDKALIEISPLITYDGEVSFFHPIFITLPSFFSCFACYLECGDLNCGTFVQSSMSKTDRQTLPVCVESRCW
ncbi:unnamed protein product [Trichobilharzia regenti]|nr:unnamed protein product [Trichobilharzia regenti]